MRPANALALCLLTGALVWVAQPEIRARLASAPADEPGAIAAPVAPDALDATPYRDAIAAIEDVLYREAPPSWSDPDRVSEAAMALGERLYADLGPPRGPRALAELVDFATAVASQADSGFAAPELDAPRAAWESLRATWFVPAPWFGRTTARLVAGQRPPAPTASLVELHEHWKWAAAIERFADESAVAFEDRARTDAEAAHDTSASFARAWLDRVRELETRAPRPPLADGETNLVFAHQALEQAVRQLALAPTGDADGDADTWLAQCFDAAATHIEAARRFLSQARTGAAAPQTAALP